MARLAVDFGAEPPAAGQRRLEGAWRGRAVTLWQGSTTGAGGTHSHVRIRVPVATAVIFELHQQSSSLGAKLVGDVEIGDPDFDMNFIVRTNDPARVTTAIAPDIRPTLVNWVRSGWLARAFVKDGFLNVEQARGLNRASGVERAGEIARAAVAIAEGLER